MLGVVNSIVNFIFFIKIRQTTSNPCGSKAQPCLTFFLKIRQENVSAYNMLHDNNCLSNFLSNFFWKTKFFRQITKIKKFFTNFFGVKCIMLFDYTKLKFKKFNNVARFKLSSVLNSILIMSFEIYQVIIIISFTIINHPIWDDFFYEINHFFVTKMIKVWYNNRCKIKNIKKRYNIIWLKMKINV